MKIIVLFALVALAVADIDYYKTPDDHLDVDAILANPSKLKLFMDCFVDKGPCDENAAGYRANIREAVEQACRRCNVNQKFMFWRFLNGLKIMHPQEYKEFKNYYDPDNKYIDALEKEISKYLVPVFD